MSLTTSRPPTSIVPAVRAMGAYHGYPRRDGDGVPTGPVFSPGGFGRMFALPPFLPDPAALVALGEAMIEADPFDPAGDNPAIPAGFTYFGQFVDHDITFDPTGLGEVLVDPLALSNFRTPKLDLDSVYGGGPAVSPFLYDRADPAKLVIGATRDSPGAGDPTLPVSMPNDLPRSAQGFALLGDPRNDENLVVAQTHLAFLKFHNAVVDHVRGQDLPGVDVFDEARRLVTWHYQWIVLHDFLGRIADPAVVEQVRTNGRRHYLPEHTSAFREPYIPVEFSVAAYRLGHSMVREAYDYNRVFATTGLTPATLGLLFAFSGLSGPGVATEPGAPGVPVPSDWIIDWRRFFDVDATMSPNLSRRLDPLLNPQLHALPGTPPGVSPSLAVRNLQRGRRMRLPSGQRVARALNLPVLDPSVMAAGPDGEVAAARNLHRRTPLWYYLLKEAGAPADQGGGDGAHMGPVGSTILAEVFLGLVELDTQSYLAQDPDWTPELSPGGGDFTMADLLRFVGDINPIG